MRYQKEYADFLRKPIVLSRDVRAVFDFSGGAAGPILKKTLSGVHRISAFYVNAGLDGAFSSRNPNPLAPHATDALARAVIRHRADLGIIFDADGDRMFVVDENGKLLDPDITAYLLAMHLKPKTIVYDINTGFLIRKSLQRETQAKMKEERVGHYFIKRTMRRINADLGIEHSGHYYFKDFFFCDSGLFAAALFLSAFSSLPYRLSDFAALLPGVSRIRETNFKIKHDPEAAISALLSAFSRMHPRRVSRRDGIYMEFKDWWFSVRPSNTEPLLRLNLEARGKKELKEKEKRISALIRPFIVGRS